MIKMMLSFFKGFIRYRKQLKKHDLWIKKFSLKKGYSINPSWMFYTNLKIWIEETINIFGKRYCPCFEPSGKPSIDNNMHCPCKYLEAEINEYGMCHCKLFGRNDLSKKEWKEGMSQLMEEYRIKLNLHGNTLDTRGMPIDKFRGLPLPDAFHQVKQALAQFKGNKLMVIVATEQGKKNMKKFADYNGLKFSFDRNQDDSFSVKLIR